ncbi:hypothetical protein Tco_0655444 [Tanacetum coccineum]|uniref:Uncharacterized protein n=1 Tax=Tanacetum coccineum TaxID=301880 RepID=A0ABQ4X616_9ASTR
MNAIISHHEHTTKTEAFLLIKLIGGEYHVPEHFLVHHPCICFSGQALIPLYNLQDSSVASSILDSQGLKQTMLSMLGLFKAGRSGGGFGKLT